MSTALQHCCKCDQPTGRCAEDSMFFKDEGPLCEECLAKATPPTARERIEEICVELREVVQEQDWPVSDKARVRTGIDNLELLALSKATAPLDGQWVPRVTAWRRELHAFCPPDAELSLATIEMAKACDIYLCALVAAAPKGGK